MAKYDNGAAVRLPLVESVIIIAIFALVSVAIMRLYVSADKLQGRSVNISKATIMAENRIEALKSGAEQVSGTEKVYLDKEWNSCGEADAFFSMTTEVTDRSNGKTGTLTDVRITVDVEGKEQLAEVVTSYYIPIG